MITRAQSNNAHKHLNLEFVWNYLRTQEYARGLSETCNMVVAKAIVATNQNALKWFSAPQREREAIGAIHQNHANEVVLEHSGQEALDKARAIVYVTYYFVHGWYASVTRVRDGRLCLWVADMKEDAAGVWTMEEYYYDKWDIEKEWFWTCHTGRTKCHYNDSDRQEREVVKLH